MQHKGNKKTLSAYLGMQLGNQEVIKLAKEVEVQQKGFCRQNSKKKNAKEIMDMDIFFHIFHGVWSQ